MTVLLTVVTRIFRILKHPLKPYKFRMEEKKNERLELRPESMDTLESKLLVRKKPKMFKIEHSSALSRVKAFMPEIKKAEVDLWQQIKIGVRY